MALHVCPGTLWLPAPETAELADAPDDAHQGWHWPSGDWLLLDVTRDPEYAPLPINVPRPGLCRVSIAGRVMRVRVLGPGDAGWAGDGYVAEVNGFLDARTRFWAQAVGGTPDRRGTLLAALCTLESGTG